MSEKGSRGGRVCEEARVCEEGGKSLHGLRSSEFAGFEEALFLESLILAEKAPGEPRDGEGGESEDDGEGADEAATGHEFRQEKKPLA